MSEIVKTEKAKQSSVRYRYRCPHCVSEICFAEDDVYDPGRAGGELTCIICPKCKKEIEI